MANRTRKHDAVLDDYAGIPVTTYDLQGSTAVEERRGYRVIVIGALVGVVVFTVLALFRAPSTLAPGVWWTAAILCLSLFLAYFPIAWGPVAQRAKPRADVVAALDPERLSAFWYERGVTDETSEPFYRDADADDENRPHP